MQKNSDIVQIIVLVVFGLGIVLGVLFFSGKIPLPGDKKQNTGPTGSLLVWGVIPYNQVNPLFDALEIKHKDLKLNYIEKKPETFQSELVNALASGKGPDVFMMNSEQVAENIDRLFIVPFDNFPQTVFKNTYADIGELLLTDRGVLAFPAFINPMVMFYNRDIFSSSFLTEPPATWDALADIAPVITQKTDSGTINQSAVALGTVNNITYAKDLVSLQLLQSGNPIITFQDKKWTSALETGTALSDTLTWYTGYSTPTNASYSWNTSLAKDKEYFISGKLGIYFGYMTEAEEIRAKNPNLNFDVAMIPQMDGAKKKTNYGKLYSIGISKLSSNRSSAVALVTSMTSKENLPQLLANTYYAPARRDLLGQKPKDNASLALVYNSAIISRAYLDPNSTKTKDAITTGISQLNSGARTMDQVIRSIVTSFRDSTGVLVLPE